MKPKMQMPTKKLEVAKGKGEPLGGDGAGTNKKAGALDSKGIKAKAPVSKGVVKNTAAASPVKSGKPQSGGPKVGQGAKIIKSEVYGTTADTRSKGGVNRFDLYSDARK